MAQKSDKPKAESPVRAELKFQHYSPANGYDSRCYTAMISGRCGVGTFSSCNVDETAYVQDALNDYASCVAKVHKLKEQVRKLRARLRNASRRSDG